MTTNPETVIDTSALMAYWLNEPGADHFYKMLRNRRPLIMHHANICELMFSMPRKSMNRLAPEIIQKEIFHLGIRQIAWMDLPFCDLAASIRLAAPALSLGDGIAVATASLLGVPVMTSEKAFLEAAEFASIKMIR